MGSGCMPAGRRQIGVMWKMVSEDCNLACDYCYYSTCGGKPGAEIKRIDSRLLDTFIRNYMLQSNGVASFAWQGGEPLLAGRSFFEEVVALQAKHAPPRTLISNSLQTNGTLLNERWASFFKTYNFLIGVSLDGPQHIHDARRVDSAGQGSFARVMKGIEHLRAAGVDFNILTVIHSGNVTKVSELMRFYELEGFDFVQFIPCMDFRSQDANAPGVYEITPRQYGDFLREAFEYWYNGGEPKTSVRFFDNMLNVYAGSDAELCVHRAECPPTLILEQNGDAYPCDFFIHPDWKLGNVAEHSIDELLSHPAYDAFRKLKPDLPAGCITCEWKKLCHGGCPRNRQWGAERETLAPDYFCASYKQIYAYADERMKRLGVTIRRRLFSENAARMSGGKTPGRNEPCAYGSGKKYKACCYLDSELGQHAGNR